MKKINKILTIISTIAALTISALPVSALYEKSVYRSAYTGASQKEDKYAYIDDSENIAWKDSMITVYKDGQLYSDLQKNTFVSFVPVNNQKLSGLPDNYKVRTPDYVYDDKNPDRKGISVNDQEELEEVTAIVKSWAQEGLVELPLIYRFYTHGCGSMYINLTLKNEQDFENIAADYPEYHFSVPSEKYPEQTQISLSKEQNTQFPEIEEIMKSDSRVESADTGYICCCVIHVLMDTPEPIEYSLNESVPVTDPVVTTIRATETLVNTTVPVSSENKKTEYETEISFVQNTASPGAEPIIGTVIIKAPVEKPVIKGDVTGDGRIDLYDAIEIAKSLISRKTFTEEETEAADYNCDGKVDLYDAIGIAEYIIKNK